MSEESGHWYLKDGTPCHRVIGKNGKERSFSLQWDRHLEALPSVTTIKEVLASQPLIRYKQTRAVWACFNNPPFGSEELQPYTNRMLSIADSERKEAADEGTDIHAALENRFSGRAYDLTAQPHIQAVEEVLAENRISISRCEIRVVSLKEGYAGTTDAEAVDAGGLGILDFKGCKIRKDKDEPYFPFDHPMQVAAYWVGHYGYVPEPDSGAWGANIYLLRAQPGRKWFKRYNATDIRENYEIFLHTCAIWRFLKKYDPRQP
jgi:hypothetical protein